MGATARSGHCQAVGRGGAQSDATVAGHRGEVQRCGDLHVGNAQIVQVTIQCGRRGGDRRGDRPRRRRRRVRIQ